MKRHLTDIDIQRYLDGATTTEESVRIQIHLSFCTGCVKAYESYMHLFETLSIDPYTPFTSGLEQQVLSQMKVTSPRPWYRRGPDFILALAGILLSIITALIFIESSTTESLPAAIAGSIMRIIPNQFGIFSWLSDYLALPYLLTGLIIITLIMFIEQVISKRSSHRYLFF